jgi:hypothetical protein
MAFTDRLHPDEVWVFLRIRFEDAGHFSVTIETVEFYVWHHELLDEKVKCAA